MTQIKNQSKLISNFDQIIWNSIQISCSQLLSIDVIIKKNVFIINTPIFRILQYNIKYKIKIITILLIDRTMQKINILIIQKSNYNSRNKSLYNFNFNFFYLIY